MARNLDATPAILYKEFPGKDKDYLKECRRKSLKKIKEKAKGKYKKKTNSVLKLPSKISFEMFCKTLSFPAYYGLFKWQAQCYREVWSNKISVVVVPRDHGKSVLWGNISQYCIQWDDYDVLYLGWTDRRKDVAENVYNFFLMWDELDSTTKTSSPYHFKTKNGGRFDTYLVTSKETLGKHSVGELDRFDKLTAEDKKELGEVFTKAIKDKYMAGKSKERKLLIFIDDPIDETFRKERHKEVKVETKYNSTIANINAEKVINSGTRKFDGDFFDFLDDKYGDKITRYKRRTHLCTPNVEHLSTFKMIKWDLVDPAVEGYNEFMEVVMSKAQSHPCYNPQLSKADEGYIINGTPTENLLCPERWTQPELDDKRAEIGEYWWHAEYEGNPHPITGAVWEKVHYVAHWDNWIYYDHSFISVDRATTTNVGSSWTGITVFVRDGRDGSKIVLKDLTGQYDFEETLAIVDEQTKWLKDIFAHAHVHVIVEKQGGGDDFIASAKRREYDFARYLYPPEGFHQTRDKLERIEDYLRLPIKNGDQAYGVRFLDGLRNTELIKEILEFPYPTRLDGIDSFATGIKVAEDFPVGDRIKQLTALKIKLNQRRAESMKRHSKVYNNPIQNPNYFKHRSGVRE